MMLLGLKFNIRGVISVATEFMVDVAGVEVQHACDQLACPRDYLPYRSHHELRQST
jgi:hypothetical protein